MFNIILAATLIFSWLTSDYFYSLSDLNGCVNGLYHKEDYSKPGPVQWAMSSPTLAVAEKEINFAPNAKSYYAVDITNGEVLAKGSEHAKLPVASLTKLMTAYLVLKDMDLSKRVSVTNFETRPLDSLMGIRPNEKLTVSNLVSGLLINSGGDAAQVLAVSHSGSVKDFVAEMNKTASNIGLSDTHFENPVGWDNENNYSSAYDISVLSRILMGNQFFADTVRTKDKVVYTDENRAIRLKNTNELLGEDGIVGVKTGYTSGAGQCLVNLSQSKKHQFLTVIIGSDDRFSQTRYFLDWIGKRYSW